jgi:hypothetical protein
MYYGTALWLRALAMLLMRRDGIQHLEHHQTRLSHSTTTTLKAYLYNIAIYYR